MADDAVSAVKVYVAQNAVAVEVYIVLFKARKQLSGLLSICQQTYPSRTRS